MSNVDDEADLDAMIAGVYWEGIDASLNQQLDGTLELVGVVGPPTTEAQSAMGPAPPEQSDGNMRTEEDPCCGSSPQSPSV